MTEKGKIQVVFYSMYGHMYRMATNRMMVIDP
jgi:hypothetical protein